MFVSLSSSSGGGRRRVVLRLALGRWYCSASSTSKGVVGMFVPLFSSSREGGRRIVFAPPSSNTRGGSGGIALRSVILGRWRRLVFAPPSSNTRGGSGDIALHLALRLVFGRWCSALVSPLRGARWRRWRRHLPHRSSSAWNCLFSSPCCPAVGRDVLDSKRGGRSCTGGTGQRILDRPRFSWT